MTFLLQSELAARGWAVTLNSNGELFDLRELATGNVIEAVGEDEATKFLDWLDNRIKNERIVA